MSRKDVIVIGASAGGVEALSELVANLPAEIDASLFVVVHIPQGTNSALPRIISRRGKLHAAHAVDGEGIQTGRLYVAPPGFHLMLTRRRIRLLRGPREHGVRPAVDPMFRSAAVAFRERVIGVVLSGNLDDGTAGLEAIRVHGGATLVQDPAEAHYPGMINSAIQNGVVGEILPVAQIARRLVELAGTEAKQRASAMGSDEKKAEEEKELAIDELELTQLQGDDQPGVVTGFTCPECHGALWELTASDALRYRCRVGHAYAVDSLLFRQQDSIEVAFWVALRALEERGALLRRLAQRAKKTGHDVSLKRYNAEAETVAANAKTIRDIILSGILSDGSESSAPQSSA